jgi:hypothetical protein
MQLPEFFVRNFAASLPEILLGTQTAAAEYFVMDKENSSAALYGG